MNELVLPFEWHSFCISLSSNAALVYHNGNQQGAQNFTWPNQQIKLPILNSGIIGGPKFVGKLADVQVFGRLLSKDELSDWTSCTIKGIFIFLKLKLLTNKLITLLLNLKRKRRKIYRLKVTSSQ